MERRWDVDERGAGIASGELFGPGLDELREQMRAQDWVTEDASAHLLPHIERACAESGRLRVTAEHQDEEGVYVVHLECLGEGRPGDVREHAYRVIAAFAESSTHVRQRTLDDAVEYDVVTGMLAGETDFRTHGHLVRLRVERPRAAPTAG